MATDLDQIGEFLRRDGIRYLVDTDPERLVCRGEGTTGRHRIEVRLSEDGDCLHLRVPEVIRLAGSPHAALLMERLLELHYQIKLGRFGLDPRDGEIDCEVVLPLDDADLTHRQFRRCFAALLLLVDQHAPRFRSILAHGEDPARDEAAQTERFLDQLAATLGMSRAELAEHLDVHRPTSG